MVLCLMVDCSNKSGRHKGVRFFRVPKVITSQGKMIEELTAERRKQWISTISREVLTEEIIENNRICGKHFKSGESAKDWDRHNIDWVPTQHLGHAKKKQEEKDLKARHERAQRAAEKRRRDIVNQQQNEIEAKVKKLNEPGEPIRNLFVPENSSFSELESGIPAFLMDEDQDASSCFENQTETCQDASTQTVEFDYILSNKNDKEKPFDEHYSINDSKKERTCGEQCRSAFSFHSERKIVRVCSALVNLCPPIIQFH
eukprot:gene17184-18913_t